MHFEAPTSVKVSAINDFHVSNRGRMVEFAGWSLPLDYGSAVSEANAVRVASGLFDVSHMGRLRLEGTAVLSCVRRLFTNDLARLDDGAGQYTLMCNPSGGVVDDLIVFRESADSLILIVNASNLEKDKAWISERLDRSVRLRDVTSETALMALQGPKAARVMESVGCSSHSGVRRFHYTTSSIVNTEVTVFRTGYTGEDGFEIMVPRESAEKVWGVLLEGGRESGLTPCGLAARDILRIEAGLPLYGHEIGESITPVEAGLMRWVKLHGRDFVGRDEIDRILKTKPRRHLLGVVMLHRTIPRSDDVIECEFGQGLVTSGTFSPILQKGIAMAFVPHEASAGTQVNVVIRGTSQPGKLESLPIYKSEVARMKERPLYVS